MNIRSAVCGVLRDNTALVVFLYSYSVMRDGRGFLTSLDNKADVFFATRYNSAFNKILQTPRTLFSDSQAILNSFDISFFSMNALGEQNKPVHSLALFLCVTLNKCTLVRIHRTGHNFFFFLLLLFSFWVEIILAVFDVIASPGDGWHFTQWTASFQLSRTIQKALKIKALRKRSWGLSRREESNPPS